MDIITKIVGIIIGVLLIIMGCIFSFTGNGEFSIIICSIVITSYGGSFLARWLEIIDDNK